MTTVTVRAEAWQVGVGTESLGARAEIDPGTRRGVTRPDQGRVRWLMAENRRLRENVAALKAASPSLPGTRRPQPLIMGFIDTLCTEG